MEQWSYWQKVIIVFLAVIVVILAYRKLLRLVGGKARFDHKFAFLFPVEKAESNELLIRFELPESDRISLTIVDSQAAEVAQVIEPKHFEAGKHHILVSTAGWTTQRYVMRLTSGNQTIERFYEFQK